MRSIGFAAILLIMASHNAFAADVNGYTAKYEKAIGTPPGCDAVISSISDPDWDKLNDPQYPVICVEPGDYSSKGTLTITESGSSDSQRWLRYFNPLDTGKHPVHQTLSERAKIKGLVFNNVSHWIIHRIYIDGDGQNVANILIKNGSHNNIFNSILNEDGGGTFNGLFLIRDSDNNTIQNSVVRNNNMTPGEDNDCFQLARAYNNLVVNNEAYGCSSKAFFITAGGAPGTIVENNDFYVYSLQYTDCNGNFSPGDPESPCASNEALISIKKGGTSTNPIQIIHNRLWGSRRTDTNVCCFSGTAGQSVSLSTGGEAAPPQAEYVRFINNIVMEGQYGVQWTRKGPNNNAIIGNLFYRIQDYKNDDTNPATVIDNNFGDNDMILLNTIVDSDAWLALGSGTTNTSVQCNVIVGSKSKAGGTPNSSTTIDSNAFYGTPSYTTGQSSTSIDNLSVSESKTSDFCFTRKLITDPEVVCIPNVVPTASSPHNQQCPLNLSSQ